MGWAPVAICRGRGPAGSIGEVLQQRPDVFVNALGARFDGQCALITERGDVARDAHDVMRGDQEVRQPVQQAGFRQ
jgi:hypothetical protein